uniref:AMP-dependent synthetase/ligase domain-containing protein n=1 Tax=Pseudonaja textilis TaxID=8673 RepID=A0A670ZDL5_PSETE
MEQSPLNQWAPFVIVSRGPPATGWEADLGEHGEEGFLLVTVVEQDGVLACSPPGPAPSAGGLWTTKRDGEVKLRMDQSGIGSETPITVHDLFLATVEKYGHLPALASKKQGRWFKLTFRQYYEECRKTAKSFLKLGLGRVHRVCILGFNSLEWFLADVGAIFAG